MNNQYGHELSTLDKVRDFIKNHNEDDVIYKYNLHGGFEGTEVIFTKEQVEWLVDNVELISPTGFRIPKNKFNDWALLNKNTTKKLQDEAVFSSKSINNCIVPGIMNLIEVIFDDEEDYTLPDEKFNSEHIAGITKRKVIDLDYSCPMNDLLCYSVVGD